MSLREPTCPRPGVVEPCLPSPAKVRPPHNAAQNHRATLIVILTIGTAPAQMNATGVPGYTNSLRTDQEKKNDRDIDRSYQSTIKGSPDAEKKNSDPWGDVRSTPPPAVKKKQQ